MVFEDLAQEAVSLCNESLKQAFETITTKKVSLYKQRGGERKDKICGGGRKEQGKGNIDIPMRCNDDHTILGDARVNSSLFVFFLLVTIGWTTLHDQALAGAQGTTCTI